MIRNANQSDKRLRIGERFGNHGLGKHGQHAAGREREDRGRKRRRSGAQQEVTGGRCHSADQQNAGPKTEDVSAGTTRFLHAGSA